MRLFRCPECGTKQRTLGHEVRHVCRGKMRTFEEVEEGDE